MTKESSFYYKKSDEIIRRREREMVYKLQREVLSVLCNREYMET